jgi:hypothetical protein
MPPEHPVRARRRVELEVTCRRSLSPIDRTTRRVCRYRSRFWDSKGGPLDPQVFPCERCAIGTLTWWRLSETGQVKQSTTAGLDALSVDRASDPSGWADGRIAPDVTLPERGCRDGLKK